MRRRDSDRGRGVWTGRPRLSKETWTAGNVNMNVRDVSRELRLTPGPEPTTVSPSPFTSGCWCWHCTSPESCHLTSKNSNHVQSVSGPRPPVYVPYSAIRVVGGSQGHPKDQRIAVLGSNSIDCSSTVGPCFPQVGRSESLCALGVHIQMRAAC